MSLKTQDEQIQVGFCLLFMCSYCCLFDWDCHCKNIPDFVNLQGAS